MTNVNSTSLNSFLDFISVDEGIYLISTSNKRFGDTGTGEEKYLKQYEVDNNFINRVCDGLIKILNESSADTGGPALEIGCGTGIFSRALVCSKAFPEYLITDASRQFLFITRALITQSTDFKSEKTQNCIHFGLLHDDELHLLPQKTFSLIAARYVLHHILDWRSFIGTSAKLLRHGGILTFEEGCRDGYLIQAILVSFLPLLMRCNKKNPFRDRCKRFLTGRASSLNPDRIIEKQVKQFVDTITWFARQDVDKSKDGDKHLFRVPEIIIEGRKHGLEVEYFPNAGYDTLSSQRPEIPFEDELYHNLRVNFGFGETIVDLVKEHLNPHLQIIRDVSGAGGSPYLKGVFVCKRVGCSLVK